MYYSSGNYEAFARPRKSHRADTASAHLVGAGLASLAAAGFLIRDAQVDPHRITILEASPLSGGACDGIVDPGKGFLIRGGREMEEHFECLWDLFRSIPSLETPGASVLDEFSWLNKDDPNYSLMRATKDQGRDGRTDGRFDLTTRAQLDIGRLFFTRDEDLADLKITDVLGRDFLDSTFWLYWRTMFAFEEWHSALEMKLYLQRFIHHIGGLPDFTALKFTKYNQYESLILPLVTWLQDQGVTFQYDTRVTNVLVEKTAVPGDPTAPLRKMARRIEWTRNGFPGGIDLTENDVVFVTNGSCVENSTWGDHHQAPALDARIHDDGIWSLWKNMARQDESFGHPEKFCSDPQLTNWESATLTTLDDRIPPYLEKICQRNPFEGRVTTGGIVTVRDSSWMMSWTINRQPHFAAQPADKLVIWIYGLFTDRPGDYVKKPMRDCTGEEITREFLYHIGVPPAQIDEMAATSAVCMPCMMPFITAFFMPRSRADRPDVVPAGSVNLAFLGQFAHTDRDTVFTTEYSVRTGMEAVYTLFDVDRGVPEVWGSVYDIRVLLTAASRLRDGRPLWAPTVIRRGLDRTVLGPLLRSTGVL
ncbi:Oleate hydratase [Austwickia sp. TVS 96-490-7B]|uniref:oleate hydratase n=1 Tax=Austwickia sp. TVS 96-490-7B TaxID=2830843 RepID=UPI001C5A03A3|nr:oleate hydratase [Austwickia sp. TVS 96-490-7B]MBW3085346.1 Oleate hydratase [Austwickia sp. TVS 96-490-7B]